jgi:Protein of unknown function (DUF3025)
VDRAVAAIDGLAALIPQALREHVAFAPYLAQLDQLNASLPEAVVAVVGWAPRAHQTVALHPIQRLHTTVGRGCPPYSHVDAASAIPHFIPPPARTLSAIDFERRVVEHNELIVRPDNLHDLLNALVWLTFPKTKRAISEAHVALGVNQDGKTRPRRRDVLTVFDESGMIVLSQRDDLRELNRTHQWRELFVTHRADFVDQARPILFGHGAMEQLGQQLPHPHRGLTAKALWLPLPVTATVFEIDHYLATRIVRGERLHEQERTIPMPLLGLPGWFAENQSPNCYDDESVFRPRRPAAT